MADTVFDRIEADILNGNLKRGDLLTELKLCEMLSVSRTPVREALNRLRQEGLIEESGKGAVVMGITERDINDIYEIRLRVEGLATAMCAEVVTDAQLKQLEETVALQEFYTGRGEVDSIRNLDSEFHRLIYSYCGSRVLSDLLSDLHRKVQRFRRASVKNPERARAAVKEHAEILDALKNHDRDRAERLAVAHIGNAWKSIKKNKD
jgi:DNA-binding GntR family transcriptional regulator